jgi:hypothetical protein
VVHDSRFLADALKHHLKIELANVHDTLCWNNVLTETEDVALKEVLAFHDLSFVDIPPPRISSIWTQRPLAESLISIACGNVESLLKLKDAQYGQATHGQELSAKEMTRNYVTFARNAKAEVVVAKHSKRFQGNRGSHLRTMQQKFNTLIAPVGKATEHKFAVFYDKPADLEAVQAIAMS